MAETRWPSRRRARRLSPRATTSVVEDYLQVLHYLTRDGYAVIAARLVERLNVTPPTVTATLQRMERDGLIAHGPLGPAPGGGVVA